MTLVRQAKHVGLNFTTCLSLIINASHIDIVFDVYRPSSIKNAERENGSVGKIRFKAIVDTSNINQWGALLSDGDN